MHRKQVYSEEESRLLEAARRGAELAYCPYSNFPVGAALLTTEGALFQGSNIENASYGLTCCAERVAIFNAASVGIRTIAMLAVSCLRGSTDNPESLMPCGACRQVMAEFMAPDATVLIDGVGRFALRDLLPRPFQLKDGHER